MAQSISVDTSNIGPAGTTIDPSDITAALSDLQDAVENLLNGAQSFDQLNFEAATELTLSGGAVTITQTLHTIDTESNAASDDLDTINGSTEGDVLYLQAAADARTVVIRHNGGGTGNIRTGDGQDHSLDDLNKVAHLVRFGTTWLLVAIMEAAGTMSSFTLAGDTGGGRAITNGNTLTVAGGDGITTADSDTDTVTVDLDVDSLSLGTPAGAADYGVFLDADDGLPKKALLNDFPSSGGVSVAVLADEKSTGTDGGASSATTWNARNLNTEVSDPNSIVSIASNQFTPVSGTYLILAHAPAYHAGPNRLRLYNVTGAAAVSEGNNAYAGSTDAVATIASLAHVFSANGTDAYRIDHYSAGADALGLGRAVSDGSNERYLEITLIKIG